MWFGSVLTASGFNKTNWVSIPAVLVAGATASQNSPFSSLAVAITIASADCAYPRRDGQAELAWVAGYVARQFTCLKTVTHPTTNRAQCKATALIETNALTVILNRHLSLHLDDAVYSWQTEIWCIEHSAARTCHQFYTHGCSIWGWMLARSRNCLQGWSYSYLIFTHKHKMSNKNPAICWFGPVQSGHFYIPLVCAVENQLGSQTWFATSCFSLSGGCCPKHYQFYHGIAFL